MGRNVKQSGRLRAAACACAAALLVAAWALPVQAARTKQEVQAEINEKKEQLEQLEQKISSSQKDKETAQAALKEYEAQYEVLVGLLDEQETLIGNTEADLDAKTRQLGDTILNIQESKALFEERLLAIYHMNDSNAVLSALLNVESLSQFLQISDTLQRVTKNDTQMLAELDAKKKTYETQKQELEDTINNLNAEKQQLTENRDWIRGKQQEMKNKVALANQAIEENREAAERTEAEMEALRKEYDAIRVQHVSSGSQKGDGSTRQPGPLLWPCPGGRFISGYGDARSNTGWHYGVDFSAPAGTPIVAAADGVVMTATFHYSYGNYVILDNYDGLRTLYAHASSLAVSPGQTVAAGQVIAYVGTTGDSTGNHLHFEVFDNGARVNPMGSGYLNP